MMAVATAAAVTPSARPAAAAEGAAPRGFGAELAAQSASAAVAASASGIAADADAESAASIEVADDVETEIDIVDALNLPTGEAVVQPEVAHLKNDPGTSIAADRLDTPRPASTEAAAQITADARSLPPATAANAVPDPGVAPPSPTAAKLMPSGGQATTLPVNRSAPPTAATATEALSQSVATLSAAVPADPAMHPVAAPDATLPTLEAAPGAPIGRLGDALVAETHAPTTAGPGVTVTLAGAVSSPGVATAATAAAMPSLPVADAAPKLAEHIEAMLEDEVWSMKLRLDPPRLGTVEVQLAVRDQQVAVSLGSGDAQARMLLAQALPELANALSARGLQLMGADVGHPSQGRDEAPARRLAQSARGEGGDAESAPTRERARQGVVDHYA